MEDTDQGKRFSHIYVSHDTPGKDSKKARFRLSKLVEKQCPGPSSSRSGSSFDHAKYAQERLENELGLKFGSRSTTGHLIKSWEWYFNRITVVEMLDSITVLATYLKDSYGRDQKKLLEETRRIFKEENLAYEIDDLGGVHPFIDGSFSATAQSAILALSGERYSATADCVNGIDDCLLQDPSDYIGAIRRVFGASENLFKLMFSVPRLDARTVGDKLGKQQQALYSAHPTLQSASAKTLEGFKDWINAAHFYRHEQGVQSPNQPTEEFAILLISQGLSYVRWLAQMDQKS